MIQKPLSVIIPTFNEEKMLPLMLEKVLKRPEVFEVIIVDDGSKDKTLQKIKPFLNKKVRLIKHQRNLGKGAAIRTGINEAKGKYLIFQDADLELNPENFNNLLKPLVLKRADFVIGTRWKNHTGNLWPKLGNRILTFLINIFFRTNVSDAYCGYKVASLETWKSLDLRSDRFEVEAEIIAKVGLKKAKIAEIDVDYIARTKKEGKKINYKDVFRGIKKIIEVRLSNL